MTLPRSYLFVPGDRPERFAKALASGADVVVLDLEDAVAPAGKSAARDAVADFLATTDALERLVVRINDESTPWFEDDLAVLRAHAVRAVMLPKAERAASVEQVRAACPGCAVLPLIESARGVLAAEAIAASPGVQRLVFGTIDYALDMDLQGELAGTVGLDAAASRLALASRAADIAAARGGRDRGDRRRDATARRPDARPRSRLRREVVHPPEADRRRSRAACPQPRRAPLGRTRACGRRQRGRRGPSARRPNDRQTRD